MESNVGQRKDLTISLVCVRNELLRFRLEVKTTRDWRQLLDIHRDLATIDVRYCGHLHPRLVPKLAKEEQETVQLALGMASCSPEFEQRKAGTRSFLSWLTNTTTSSANSATAHTFQMLASNRGFEFDPFCCLV